ncbi:MAG TPA: hypothetical protein PKH77_05160 [Anaerolineae bacterium]|nr:hypothetical protein [Anaerolineae bacterium]
MTAIPQGPTLYAETLPAGEDLSAKRFYFVKRSGDTYVACAAVTDLPDGVLQNKPELGQPCEVIAFGPTKLSADAAIAVGAFIGPSADGQATTRTPNHAGSNYACGRARGAASVAGNIIPAIINCITPVLGA